MPKRGKVKPKPRWKAKKSKKKVGDSHARAA